MREQDLRRELSDANKKGDRGRKTNVANKVIDCREYESEREYV
jgi:hypothetical protein